MSIIQIQGNVKIGGQIIIGDVFAVPTSFITDTDLPGQIFLTTEDGVQLITELP